jgi:hypothetical protein
MNGCLGQYMGGTTEFQSAVNRVKNSCMPQGTFSRHSQFTLLLLLRVVLLKYNISIIFDLFVLAFQARLATSLIPHVVMVSISVG